MMAKIIVEIEIDCEEYKCGKCKKRERKCFGHGDYGYDCGVFDVDWTNDSFQMGHRIRKCVESSRGSK
jgi:hypothetical protein